ncbi:DarT ssDNA thymidine ADP-ribosyltransferase family protein [Acinetobacter sp. YH12245]|uniref:DarT ssDNA thymidine ADP-ribosyltransferase family protein n=1 Tax=Acinetobacter sp. YH12245 TaxID=2601171 RepID=UPI0015D45ADB|nr:DarT ssDNA thymidine ADP-ribosyltransferase family protein [Acinetobacter sp. YH12245]
MEILFLIGGFFLLFILIAPLVNAFGSNSPHKDKSQAEKKELALKDIKKNYDTSKDLFSKGLKALSNGASQFERLTGELADKAEQNRIEHQKNKPENYREKIIITNTMTHEMLCEYSAQAYFLEIDLGLDDFKVEDIYGTETYKNKKNEFLKILELNDGLLKPIKNFIAVRYYLTTFKNYPNINTLNAYFEEKIPESFPVFHELIWEYCLKKIEIDQSKLKKINALYHFTHKNNLRSILEKGLITKARLEKLEINFIENDKNRWDEVEDSISLSISHPNHKMFMKYAKSSGLDNWVVLKISPELLSGNTNPAYEELENYDYLDKAIFNKFNAASFAMRNLSIEERKSHQAFLDMFESNIGMTLETYTFDNQAEILYQGNIPKEFIQEIHMIEEDPDLSWVSDLGFELSINKTVFEKR